MKFRHLIPLALALGLPAAVGQAQQPSACGTLAGLKIPAAAIGLKTTGATIAAAQTVTNPDQGTFCKVTGAISPIDPAAPPINFQINLPAEWNGKAVHYGGGGYNGSVVTGLTPRMAPPGHPLSIKLGYVTFGSDSGHQAAPGSDTAAFAANAESLANFGGDQLKKTHDVAVALIERRYGAKQKRMYFFGNSQGGHEGLTVIQRWPTDYDGVVAIHPVYNFAALQTNGVQMGQVLYRSPEAWISPAKARMTADAVLAVCDGLDGLKDGVIANVNGCNKAFDLKALRCAGGKDSGDKCLSDPQIVTLRTLATDRALGVTLQGGVTRFSRWPVLEGGLPGAGRVSLGATPKPGRPSVSQDAFIYFMGDQMVRNMVTRDLNYDSMTYDPKKHAAALRRVSDIIDASDDDISAYKARGGKLILIHGTTDMAVPWHNTTAYYARLERRFGKGARDFVRYYVAPGYGHGDGPFVTGWDVLGAVDAWADQGIAPGPVVEADLNRATLGRTRPLCEYPGWPKYRGSGDPAVAASFACVTD